MKYIIVTGGVVSGLGKGITISSIGRILKSTGLRVTSIKIDPYLNVDAGTMSPFEHGEAFVLDDGGETDLDLGNYERFLDVTLTGKHNITSGKIYKEVIRQERRGDYLGKTVQMVPHATDMVQKWIEEVAKISVDGTGLSPDVCLVEVGGTVGDIESMIFLEALRQFQFKVGRENIVFVHVSLVPVMGTVGEQKTKPTQHSVKELRALGLSPDLIVCRATEMLCQSTKNKISTFCHVSPEHIISVHDVSNIYHVPLILQEQGLYNILKSKLQLGGTSSVASHSFDENDVGHRSPNAAGRKEVVILNEPALNSWRNLANTVDNLKGETKIAMVGKYVGLQDSYLSVIKALKHSAIHLGLKIEIVWLEASDLEEETKVLDVGKYNDAWAKLKAVQGILVPGGFGSRGVTGMIAATKYARKNGVPFLGVCLGMQVMVIEYARHVLSWSNANSAEIDESTSKPVIIFMPEISQTEMGGTMRLGARSTTISKTIHARAVSMDTTSTADSPTVQTMHSVGGKNDAISLGSEIYGYKDIMTDTCSVNERHRHRYEVNPIYAHHFESAGLYFTGRDDNNERMEITELPRSTHPFFIGVQFHPEFKSRPSRPSPPFFGFAAAAAGQYEKVSMAGQMWREYEEELKEEIDWIYSPRSGVKKRSISITEGFPASSLFSQQQVCESTSPTEVSPGMNDAGIAERKVSDEVISSLKGGMPTAIEAEHINKQMRMQ